MQFPLMLREALPFLKQFYGQTFVIKTGGAVLNHPDFLQLIKDVSTLVHLGIKVAFVFGAGPQFDKELKEANIPFQKINGLRVTTKEMVPILKKLSIADFERLSKIFEKENIKPVLIEKYLKAEPVELTGFKGKHYTGKITKVNKTKIKTTFKKNHLPTCFSIVDNRNCNADDVALSIAKSLKAKKIIYLTGARGVYIEHKNDRSEFLPRISVRDAKQFIKIGKIKGGMIPKVKSAIKAVQAGIPVVHIISGLMDGTLLTEVFTEKGCGTMIAKDVSEENE